MAFKAYISITDRRPSGARISFSCQAETKAELREQIGRGLQEIGFPATPDPTEPPVTPSSAAPPIPRVQERAACT